MVISICDLLMLLLIYRTRAACECTGDNKFDESLKLKWGEDYGEACKAWDLTKCHRWAEHPHNLELGAWCCERWCYVDSSCPSGTKSGLWDNLHFSHDACSNEPSEVAQCDKKYEEKDRVATCKHCHAQDMDYCIERNECTERATKTCNSAEDHITSDPEFRDEPPGHCMDCQEAANGQCVANRDDYNPAGAIFGLLVVSCLLGTAVAFIVRRLRNKNQTTMTAQPGAVSHPIAQHSRQLMQVTCPAGVAPGHTLHIQTPGGQTMQFVLPEGVQEGQSFHVQVPDTVPTVMGMPLPSQAVVGTPMNSNAVVGMPVESNSGVDKAT